MKKLKIDEDKCIGCGTCAALYSGHFRLIDGRAMVIDNNVDGCGDVINSCPMDAISII